jgi:hypothetical protein
MARVPSGPSPVPLRALGGQSASPDLASDLRLLLELPPPAREQLWSVLGPSLAEWLPDRFDAELEALRACLRAGRGGPSSRAARVSRARSRRGARGIDAAALAADAHDLTGSDEPGLMLARGFDAATALVCREAMRSALAEHGSVLDRVDWRVDHVGGSSRRDGLKFGFAVLTLRYEQEGRRERLTLQVTPETLVELEAACRAILGPGSPAGGAGAKGSPD